MIMFQTFFVPIFFNSIMSGERAMVIYSRNELVILIFTGFSLISGNIAEKGGLTNNYSGKCSGFTQNKGQIIDPNGKPNPSVLYLLNTPGRNRNQDYHIYLLKCVIMFRLSSITHSLWPTIYRHPGR